jgi:P27 family predicted phage terminase small subunit
LAATAAAQKLADELGIDLDGVDGSGKDGKVVIGDVRELDAANAAGMPSDFAGREKRIWEDVESHLKAKGLWDKVYSELLERYIRALTRAAEARKEEAEEGSVTEGSTGQLVTHPAVKRARDAEHDALDLAKELLITPAAQLRHEKEAAPPDDEIGGAEDPNILGF